MAQLSGSGQPELGTGAGQARELAAIRRRKRVLPETVNPVGEVWAGYGLLLQHRGFESLRRGA